ncbi:terminase TerL endonuclease subunit, partial [Bacillus sp. mrc49]|uniref:terminase TerL endonuclease subunit n=1 Tax=Bacillus sp. mrc49 TaxID=2054913 RepID=UPI000CC59655
YKMIVSQLKKVRNISPGIRKITKIVQNEIRYDNDDSLLKPLSRDTDNLDGMNVLLGILDEYHTSATTEMMEVLESSQGQQPQPLILIISTAGFKLNGPMYSQEYPYIKKILSGEEINDNYFAICYEQDDIKEINKEKLWIKSNPLLEVAARKDVMSKNIKKKLTEARAKNDLGPTVVKNFNMWQNASKESFLKGEEWAACAIELEPFITGKDAYIGVDLSRTTDLTAVSWIVPYVDEEGNNR